MGSRTEVNVQRKNVAVANHEFEKARFYSEEERKERANLAELEKKHGVKDRPSTVVTCSDLEQVIAKWKAYPYEK